jgi:hypothetical protein
LAARHFTRGLCLVFKAEFNGVGGLRNYIRTRAGPSPVRLPPRRPQFAPPSWGRFFSRMEW